MRLVALALLASACGAPQTRAVPTTAPGRLDLDSPPPPAPPPTARETRPPPHAIAAFLRAHAASSAPWSGTIAGRALSPDDAADLARRFGEDTAYSAGDYGCFGDDYRLTLRRDNASLELRINCGHVIVDETVAIDHVGNARVDDHVIVSHEMLDRLDHLRGAR